MGTRSSCRTCAAAIIWCATPGGSRMPVDATPTTSGTLVLTTMAGDFITASRPAVPTRMSPIVREWTAAMPPDVLTFRSHFATCPHATKHRRSSSRSSARVRTGDGAVAIVCGRGIKACVACGEIAGYLCDHPTGGDATCDANLCERHAAKAPGARDEPRQPGLFGPEPDRKRAHDPGPHLCPRHLALVTQKSNGEPRETREGAEHG